MTAVQTILPVSQMRYTNMRIKDLKPVPVMVKTGIKTWLTLQLRKNTDFIIMFVASLLSFLYGMLFLWFYLEKTK